MSNDSKPSSKPTASPLVKIQVLEPGTVIGKHVKGRNRIESIPLSEAKTLEGLGKVKIIGV
jgi:hypothetical protein